MVRSEIFERYAEIAKEQGLLRKKSSTDFDPRVGSDDISTIEALYGVKPNGKDEKDILDQAHPESVIIAPSYDRLNGLVENLRERQDIMVGIVMKPHQGKLTQHRYAQTKIDLVNELVRLGFYLESSTKENDLVDLADACAEKLTKKAALPLVVWLAAGYASALGLLGVYNNFGDMSQGIRADCQKVEEILTSMISDDDYDSSDETLDFMLRNIAIVRGIADRIETIRMGLPPANLENAAAVKESKEYKKMEKLLDYFSRQSLALSQDIPKYISIVSALDDNPNKEKESNWWAAAKAMYRKLDPTDANNLIQTLNSLGKSLASAPETINKIRAQYQEAAEFKQKKLLAEENLDSIAPVDEKTPTELKEKITDKLKDLSKTVEE